MIAQMGNNAPIQLIMEKCRQNPLTLFGDSVFIKRVMDTANRSLQAFTRRVQLMMVYRTALKWAGVWVMVMGVVVLVVRFTGALPANWWHYALLSLMPLIGAAWFCGVPSQTQNGTNARGF